MIKKSRDVITWKETDMERDLRIMENYIKQTMNSFEQKYPAIKLEGVNLNRNGEAWEPALGRNRDEAPYRIKSIKMIAKLCRDIHDRL